MPTSDGAIVSLHTRNRKMVLSRITALATFILTSTVCSAPINQGRPTTRFLERANEPLDARTNQSKMPDVVEHFHIKIGTDSFLAIKVVALLPRHYTLVNAVEHGSEMAINM
jgi:hypothetical protein